MEEIKVKNNELNIPVYIEDMPDLSTIPETELNLLMKELELFIFESIDKKIKRKQSKNKNLPP